MVNLMKKMILVTVLLSTVSFAENILIKNARIHTLGTQGTLENGSMLIIDGKISTVGTDIPEQADYIIIDARGKQITPGLMNAATALGLVEISAVKSTVDTGSSEKGYSASISIAEVINPNSTLFAHNRINGLTRAMVKPGSNNTLFAGSGSLIKLSADMQPLVVADNATYLTYGAAGAKIAGGSRALALLQIKEVFQDLKSYVEDAEKFKPKSNLKKRDIKALLPMFKAEVPLVVTVHQVSDILAMLRLQKQYSIKMIFAGAAEAWKVADKIAAANIPVLMDPYSNLPGSFQTIANRLDSAALLNKAGVELIFTNNSSHNAYVVRQSAGNAVTHGLPWDVALAAITSTPAKWFGIGNSYGTLEAGMDADLVIWDGDPLEVTTSVEQVFIQGKAIPMVSRQTRLRDRYLNKGDKPAAYSK